MHPFPKTKIPTYNSGRLGANAGGPKTTLDAHSKALLFSPLTLRSITFKNRIGVSPMCQYSSTDGFPNAFHFSHISQFAIRGAGLVIVEATGVTPNGRITPNCLGLYSQSHADAFKPIVDFVKSQGCVAAIQLGHAGRKASTLSPFFTDNQYNALATEADGGWPNNVVGPSPIKQAETTADVIELTGDDIQSYVDAFVNAAKLADNAGFDVIEIHGAHGYLLHSFLSPFSNQRKDEYGGSLENRMRFPVAVAKAVRQVWPDDKPLFFRLSVSDWAKGGLTSEESVLVCRALKEVGVDLIDCSSGGVVAPEDPSKFFEPGYNVAFAEQIRVESGVATAAVGNITEAQQAEDILKEGKADLVLLAREFLRNPQWVLESAQKLGAEVEWPIQYRRGKPRI
ncbi:NADH:flavin oxidoreductase/NADH oxidase [Rhizoclosmatium globosum]|uniref:NADH:flavin oxidoreductase/NADH oxidase n=1 Tax=Rhizoclosmatium globosum TaxID=329046 RepID=A0A1Y2CM73_9FUNG|nr:NADH:flavin oxidoreductase/NADH oxidase [Rhizoclosmatium globosum]|eukprot:ORY48026.1 NADH:flavin oxidoreductase/NADH oxidase [Rhizoclosmatium globosum]